MNVKSEIEIQNPECELINICQKPDTSLGQGSKLWLDIKPQLSLKKT